MSEEEHPSEKVVQRAAEAFRGGLGSKGAKVPNGKQRLSLLVIPRDLCQALDTFLT